MTWVLLAEIFGNRSEYSLQLVILDVERNNDFESLKEMSRNHDRMRTPKEIKKKKSADDIDKCTTIEEIKSVWQEKVFAKHTANLTKSDFEDLIQIMGVKVENLLDSVHVLDSGVGKMVADIAFNLLDVDSSNTITFTEFEVRHLC